MGITFCVVELKAGDHTSTFLAAVGSGSPASSLLPTADDTIPLPGISIWTRGDLVWEVSTSEMTVGGVRTAITGF